MYMQFVDWNNGGSSALVDELLDPNAVHETRVVSASYVHGVRVEEK